MNEKLGTQLAPRQWQLTYTFARGREDPVAKRGREWRNARFSHTSRGRAALDDVHVGLVGGLVHPRYGIAIEIGLIDGSASRCDFSEASQAGAEDGRALELGSRGFRVDDQSGVYRGVDSQDAKLALIVDFDLDDCSHVREEAPVDGDAHALALAEFSLSPTGFFRG